MAFYKLKKDFKTKFINGVNEQDELYWKVGSVIGGELNGSNIRTNVDGGLPRDDFGSIHINIPTDYLELTSETKKNLILDSSSTGQETPKNDKTFFTTKNIVIGVVGIVAILGILKWKKII